MIEGVLFTLNAIRFKSMADPENRIMMLLAYRKNKISAFYFYFFE